MHKRCLYKLLVLLSVLTVVVSVTEYSMIKSVAITTAPEIIAPYNIAIQDTTNELYIKPNGELSCLGITTVYGSKIAGVKVELQYNTGKKWETIETWTQSSMFAVTIDESYALAGVDGTYRLKTTHYAYNSNGGIIEEIIKYSDEVTV